MFNNLIESKPTKQGSVGQSITSIILHGGLIALMVVVTANAGIQQDEKAAQEDIQFMEAPKNEPPPPEPDRPPPPPDVVAAPPPPKGFQVLTAPIDIPDKIPEVDLSKAVTDEADFSGKGVQGGIARGVEGGTAPVVSDQPYFEFQVEKPALAREGNPQPRYPEMLRSAGIEGEVIAQFVVNEDGRADMSTFKSLSSSHAQFTAAVRAALPQMRFYPAEVGGRKVKQLVQQAFKFSLAT
ncbi:MAG TPA: energy transducer TonB [Gemmatimonadaceae bacterium]|nr:energy transducer TonB [Gemmatimonadaceae bacterium]